MPRGGIRYGLRPSLLPPRAEDQKIGGIENQLTTYTYPQLATQRPASTPGSKFGRHGGSNLNRRGQARRSAMGPAYSSSTSMARNSWWCSGGVSSNPKPRGSATVCSHRSTPSLEVGSHKRLKTMARRQPSVSTSDFEPLQARDKPSRPSDCHSCHRAHTSPAERDSRNCSSLIAAPEDGPASSRPWARCSDWIRRSTSPPGSRRPSVARVRWRGWPASLRKDSTSCA